MTFVPALGGPGAITWAKESLGVHSPSAEFAKIGSYSAQGYAQGIQRALGSVELAVGGLSSAALGSASSGPSGGAGGVGPQITQTFIIGNAGDPGQVANLMAQVEAATQDAVERALGRMGRAA
jgi:hypothetical protein